MKRLIDEGATELEAAVLQTASMDDPPRGARERALAAIGVGAAVTTGAKTAVATLGVKTAAATAGAKAWTGLAIKVGLGLVLCSAAAVSTTEIVRTRSAREASSRAVHVAPIAPGQGAPAPAMSAAASTPPTEEIAAAPTSSMSSRAQPGVAARTPAGLSEEIAALDEARRALDAKRPEQAMRALHVYDRLPGRHMLSHEATVLRVQALLASGRREQARNVGESFLRAQPNSPHADRIRALLPPRGKSGSDRP